MGTFGYLHGRNLAFRPPICRVLTGCKHIGWLDMVIGQRTALRTKCWLGYGTTGLQVILALASEKGKVEEISQRIDVFL